MDLCWKGPSINAAKTDHPISSLLSHEASTTSHCQRRCQSGKSSVWADYRGTASVFGIPAKLG